MSSKPSDLHIDQQFHNF